MEIAKAIVVMVALIGAIVYTGKAVYHMYYVVTNITNKNAGYFGGFLLFMPKMFNELGNKHRNQLLISLLVVIIGWLVLIAVGAVKQ